MKFTHLEKPDTLRELWIVIRIFDMKRTGSQLKRKFYKDNIRRAISRSLFGRRDRDEAYVLSVYKKHYDKSGDLELDIIASKSELFRRNDCVEHFPSQEYKRELIKNVSAAISRFEPKSILDMGCGRGFFVMALAVLHPSISKVRGIELSPSGVAYAHKLIANPPIETLKILTGLSDLIIRERLKNRDIEIIQGTIRSLPYADNSIDFVYSNSVIEQFPRDYMLPFQEAYRVVSKVALFSEPFREAEPNILRRLHLKNLDYFNASYHEVEKTGFAVHSFSVPTLQKFAFNTGVLVCEKQNRRV